MTDNQVNSVPRVEVQGVKAVQTQVSTMAAQAEKESAPMKAVEAASKQEAPKYESDSGKSSNRRQTNLRFRVNPETHEVMVMVVDRSTDKVIATIPPEAIKDIPAGELFQYSA